MAIDAIQQVIREIPAASAVPQLSLTRRDRQLQMEEGNPPMEVALTEQDALRWQKNEDLQEKWKKRHREGNAGRRQASQGETPGDGLEEEPVAEEAARITPPEFMQESTELQQGIELSEEEETGTLFDDRS